MADAVNIIDYTDPSIRHSQLKLIIESGLDRMKSKQLKYTIFGHEFVVKEQIAQAAELVEWGKDWISDAVKSSAEASVAWAGICVILPLLTRPAAAEKANNEGLTYVTARIRYYAALEPMFIRLTRDSRAAKTSKDLTEASQARIVELYRNVIEFQISSVFRFYRRWIGNLGRDLMDLDDWQGSRDKIKALETAVQSDLDQIVKLLSREELESSREELEQLNKKTLESQQTLSRLLVLAEDRERKADQEAMRKCHQIFRRTKGDKDDSYEWYKGRVDDRAEGTCNWFLNHENYKSWLHQDSGPLLVSADPGCGKSVLSKYLVDHALPRDEIICYYFFKDQDQNSLSQALCALIHQLFSQRQSLIRYAMDEYSRNGEALINVTASLWEILTAASYDADTGPVIFVLDALDECIEPDFRYLAELLKKEYQSKNANTGRVKFLLTSRPYGHIVSQFDELVKTFPYIRIPGEDEAETISQEINAVIKLRVRQFSEKKHLSEKLASHLEKELTDVPHRTYLWIYLVFDELERADFKKTEKGIDAAIATLPKTVNAAYESILERNKHKDRPIVRRALCIILAAFQPLTIEEMNIAVNMDISLKSVRDLDLESDNDFQARLRSWCGLFVSIYHGKVYFLHQTAREFLLASQPLPLEASLHWRWHQSITEYQAHAVLAEVCVVSVNLISWDSDPAYMEENFKSLEWVSEYASPFWPQHVKQAKLDSNAAVMDVILTVLLRGQEDTKVPPLSAAIKDDLDTVVRRLLDDGADIECREAELGYTPLHRAIVSRRPDMVKLLLDRGANIDATDMAENEPLLLFFLSASTDRRRRRRLDRLAEGKTDGFKRLASILISETALLLTIARYLLEGGANMEVKDAEGRTPAIIASEESSVDMLQLLVEHGANIEAYDREINTPLNIAAVGNSPTSLAKVAFLLKSGANVETVNYWGLTPLLSATSIGGYEAVRLLVRHGANLEARSRSQRTALLEAVYRDFDYVAKILIDLGADIEVQDISGVSPLGYAAIRGDPDLTALLLQRHASTESKDNEGRTPLGSVASWNPDMEKPTQHSHTLTSQHGYARRPPGRGFLEDVIELLLKHGANIEARDNYGRTPLANAARNKWLNLVQFLLDHGADPDARDVDGEKPIDLARAAGLQDNVDLLLKRAVQPGNQVTEEFRSREPDEEASSQVKKAHTY
jgi:ankyrin repeat protein